ncbi:uncharacterized protein LOC103316570 isoform X2 [Nasonia vitripennis]|uniref:Uncharacterized protein n=1 Tax=Nasonia vitripennis TaxID=7425 RepID=A0A7M7T850_NASVI|nr:uncharacterized protein LOC103316570 isoform X2 [Nasonia vitripennis]
MRMLNPTPSEFMGMILRILRYVLECVPDMTQSKKKQMIRITKKLLTIKRAILKRNKRKHTRRQSRYMKYGWLSRRPDFQLENYGSYIVKYPNPMDEIVLLEGDVPTLAVGKGFLL